MNDKLTARVVARNRVNAYANVFWKDLIDRLTPFVGCKVLKADGSLLKNVECRLPETPNTNALHVYHSSPRSYSLTWTVKACQQVPGECHCVYEELTIYVGELDGNVLKDLRPFSEYPENYMVADVLKAREEYREAERVASRLREALYPFGETDR